MGSETYNIQVNPDKPYFNLEIASTPNCNMACSYCFEGEELQSKSKQTKENIPLIVERMNDLMTDPKFFTEYRGICVNFWGGEPTINYDWNKQLFDAIKDKDWCHLCSFFIYSNGYDFKKVQKHIDMFTKEEIDTDILRIQISWDGIPGERIDHKKEQTYLVVEKNIKNIALINPNLNLKIKATIQPQELLTLKSTWMKFFDLHLWTQKKNPNTKMQVNFSPTLNYIDDYLVTPEYLKKINESFIEVAKYELEFFKQNKRHLFGWFDADESKDFLAKRKTNCSAGINIMAFDIEGSASVCHGTLYSPMKKEFKAFHDITISTPKQEFRTKFYETREQLKSVHQRFDPECQECTATICYKCPIVNVEKAQEKTTEQFTSGDIVESFQNRDTRHCDIYKTFGLVDRSLFKLKENFLKRTDNG